MAILHFCLHTFSFCFLLIYFFFSFCLLVLLQVCWGELDRKMPCAFSSAFFFFFSLPFSLLSVLLSFSLSFLTLTPPLMLWKFHSLPSPSSPQLCLCGGSPSVCVRACLHGRCHPLSPAASIFKGDSSHKQTDQCSYNTWWGKHRHRHQTEWHQRLLKKSVPVTRWQVGDGQRDCGVPGLRWRVCGSQLWWWREPSTVCGTDFLRNSDLPVTEPMQECLCAEHARNGTLTLRWHWHTESFMTWRCKAFSVGPGI